MDPSGILAASQRLRPKFRDHFDALAFALHIEMICNGLLLTALSEEDEEKGERAPMGNRSSSTNFMPL